MYKPRLTSLADGIFSIVMTLLAFEIRVPQLYGTTTNAELWVEILHLLPLFASYVLSFAVLATFWLAHHYTISVYAKDIDRRVINLNIPFLMFVSLIPFSSHLLGLYSTTQIAIIIYSINIVIVGLLLAEIFRHVIASEEIENPAELTSKEARLTYVRILLPVICGIFAIGISWINPLISLYFLIFAVVFNLIPGGSRAIDHVFLKLIKHNNSKEVRSTSVVKRKQRARITKNGSHVIIKTRG